jgi:hypothetical protein
MEAHPLEAWWLRLHAAFAFGALWLVGFLSARHIVNGWVSRRRRLSGLSMLGGAGILILTGYLLYYLSSDGARGIASIAHWGVGLFAPALFIWHRFAVGRRRARETAERPANGVREERRFQHGVFHGASEGR